MSFRLSLTLSLMLVLLTVGVLMICRKQANAPGSERVWQAPDTLFFPSGERGALVSYGRSLIARTSAYFGPRGKIAHLGNGMNCQNCHLKAGTQPWGNNYGGVTSTYPKFRERRGSIETVVQRITDCFERSLNGRAPDSSSREMKAIVAYMQWVGQSVPKGKKPAGSGLATLEFLTRAADPNIGGTLYIEKCESCHGPNGQGQLSDDSLTYTYPPLWGEHSYNTGAGLYRLSRLAGYIKNNMPFGTDYTEAQLNDEEAWDLAAFVNSQPRPDTRFAQDWPNESLKPVDHPFGPYADHFSEVQHKYGPFGPIQEARKSPSSKP